MRVLICGSISYGRREEMEKEMDRLQEILRREGFEVLYWFEYDFSDVEDFRDRRDFCAEMVRGYLELCDMADVLVLIAKHLSFDIMAEVVVAAMKGKPVIAFCPDEVKSPWPIYFANYIAKSENGLILILRGLKEGIRTIPNIYCDHEVELTYEGLRCVCPVTGLEDRGVVRIRYKPRDRLLEYESLDRYFRDFEGRRMHHEAIACKIYNDLLSILNSEWLEVTVEFEERSNVKAVVKISGAETSKRSIRCSTAE